MKIMKKINLIILTATLIFHTTHCTVEAELPATVKSKVFDRTTGTLFLGLEGESGAANSISRVNRFSGVGKPIVTGIAGTNLTGKTIEFLALSTSECETSPLLVTVAQATNPLEQKEVNVLTHDGATMVTTDEELNDADGEAATTGIVAIAASSSHIFAAVRPTEDTSNNFGDTGSGIALIGVDKPPELKLNIKDATTGQDGNQALPLDKTSDEIKIGGDVTFGLSGASDATSNQAINLHWNEKLQRLYIALWVKSGGASGDGARSVVVGRVLPSGLFANTLALQEIAPAAAFDADQLTNIIGAKKTDIFVVARRVRVMHTSTGLSYLIVSGNVYEGTDVKINKVFALPLVDNQSKPTEHGTLAKKDAALANGKFVTAATANADLPTSNEIFAKVGGFPLPIPNEGLPSDIVVVGDTVYVTIEEAADDTHDPGIFYSQALFDETGKIVRWTMWAKRAFPFNGFASITDTADKGRVKFFDIDAHNGKIWAINGVTTVVGSESVLTAGKLLASTGWSSGSYMADATPTTLVGKLNHTLKKGCFSVLDLDQKTRGLGTSSPGRYALFGGLNKVVFARISKSKQGSAPFDFATDGSETFRQTVMDDFSDSTNFLETYLPSGAGAVTSLEYSRRINTSTNQNYFFAGTQNGLYVFAQKITGVGFTIASFVNVLNNVPFSDGQWYKMDGIQGSVIAITTSGNGNPDAGQGALYVLTMQATGNPEHPIISRIYNIPFDETYTAMQASIYLIAQSKFEVTDSDLSSVKEILGMQIISTAANATKEQLVITTNRGLFRSNADQTGTNPGVINAKNQTLAKWEPVTENDTAMYSGIFEIDAQVKTTVWPIQVSDEKGMLSFERSSIKQLNGAQNTPPSPFTFNPTPFNSADTTKTFQTLYETTHFWSDGARRFFIVKRPGDPSNRNRLMVMPHDANEWHICNPNQILSDPKLSTVRVFYWVKHIGATGILMAGTNFGIIALE